MRTVLFIHGLGNSHRFWELAQVHLEQKGVASVAIDIPGFGDSAAPASGVSLAAAADRISLACDELGFEKVCVVAHSLGAFVGLELARMQPDRFERLLLVDGTLNAARSVLSGERSLRESPKRLVASLAGQFVGAIAPFRSQTAALLARSSRLRSATLWPFVANPKSFQGVPLELALQGGGSPLVLKAIVAEAASLDLRELLGSVEMPVDQIRGDADRLILQEDVELYSSLLENFGDDVLTVGAGHWPMLEDPDQFHEQLDNWLSRD